MAANWISAPKRTHRAGGLLAVIAGLVFIGIGLVPEDTAAEGNEDTQNQVEDWCDAGGTKFDDLSGETFTVPAPPDGVVWGMAVVKAGHEDTSVEEEHTIYPSVQEGDVLRHDSGKEISWVIICWQAGDTTTSTSTTTAATSTTSTTSTTTSTTVPGSSTTTSSTSTTTPRSTSTTASTTASTTTSTTTPGSSTTSSTSTSVASQAGTTSTTAVAAAGGTTTTIAGAAGALPATGGDADRNTALIALGAILVLAGGALVWLGRPTD